MEKQPEDIIVRSVAADGLLAKRNRYRPVLPQYQNSRPHMDKQRLVHGTSTNRNRFEPPGEEHIQGASPPVLSLLTSYCLLLTAYCSLLTAHCLLLFSSTILPDPERHSHGTIALSPDRSVPSNRTF